MRTKGEREGKVDSEVTGLERLSARSLSDNK